MAVGVEVSPFLTDPRLSQCSNIDCRHNMAKMNKYAKYCGELTCHFKVIEIGQDGKCKQFEIKGAL